MKKIAALCVAALGAAFLVLGTAPSASAYPDLSCDLSVNRQVVKPGQTFTATGTASGVDANNHVVPDADIQWTLRWNGVTKHRSGAVVTATFTAPKVARSRTITLTGRANTPSGTCVRHIDITVANSTVAGPTAGGGGGGGLLPGTGGPAFWVLVAALLLLVGGGGAVVAGRRRS